MSAAGAAGAGEIAVARLDASREPDFWELHAEKNGEGWCCCVAWHVPSWEGWPERTAEQNRAVREELFGRGGHDGYLLYEDGAPVGWCQVGPRDRLPKLATQMGLAPDPDAWAVTCFVLAPHARGRGLAHRFLAGVLDDLRARGVRRVEAFPRRVPEEASPPGASAGRLEPGQVWNGPLAIYRRAGFAVEGETERNLICALTP